MAPHISAYEKAKTGADEAWNTLSRRGNTRELRVASNVANLAHEQKRSAAHEQARTLGTPVGAFLKPRLGEEDHARHMERISSLHNSTALSGRGANEKVHFFNNEKDRDAFHKAVEHRYKGKYKISSRSRDEHGHYYDHPGMANREEPHRVEISERSGGASFHDWHEAPDPPSPAP
jgi:hypothetical protein